jgi:hypothetical protein
MARAVFDPSLRLSKPNFGELRGALQALSDCGVLLPQSAASATKQLDLREQERQELVRRRSIISEGPTIVARNASEHLQVSLSPNQRLGVSGGLTIVLTGVWLWSTRLVLRMEAEQNELTRSLDAVYDAAVKRYEERWRAHRAGAPMDDEELAPPDQPSVERLGSLPLSVSDNLGNAYHALGTATGGPHQWRSEWRLEPAVPSSATQLEIALASLGPNRQCVTLALPARAEQSR